MCEKNRDKTHDIDRQRHRDAVIGDPPLFPPVTALLQSRRSTAGLWIRQPRTSTPPLRPRPRRRLAYLGEQTSSYVWEDEMPPTDDSRGGTSLLGAFFAQLLCIYELVLVSTKILSKDGTIRTYLAVRVFPPSALANVLFGVVAPFVLRSRQCVAVRSSPSHLLHAGVIRASLGICIAASLQKGEQGARKSADDGRLTPFHVIQTLTRSRCASKAARSKTYEENGGRHSLPHASITTAIRQHTVLFQTVVPHPPPPFTDLVVVRENDLKIRNSPRHL